MKTYETTFFGEVYSASADWDQASGQVFFKIDGDAIDMGGQQVADFRHVPELALREAIERNVNLNFDESIEELADKINAALDAIKEI